MWMFLLGLFLGSLIGFFTYVLMAAGKINREQKWE